ncbi:MAG: thrombospondin type 3 repeat-containing protein [Myxococcales bacterium]|nr:thrombospondin type 3 repeat-containing protein [Myxococcales bacterium]
MKATRSLARSLARARIVPLLAAMTLLSCTHDPLARQDVHDGPGVLLPVPGVADPGFPGGKRATLLVSDASIASLKQDLTAALDVGSDFDANAVVILNPTADRIPENGNCAPGNWRACLRVVRLTAPPGQATVNLLPGLPTINYDLSRVSIPPGSGSLAVGALGAVGVELAALDAKGNVAVESWTHQAAHLFPDPNTELRLRFSPGDMYVGGRLGSLGIWMPATLTPNLGEAINYCVAGGIKDFGEVVCDEILSGMNAELGKLSEYVPGTDAADFYCNKVTLITNIRRVRLWMGFIPRTIPGCVPDQFRWDLEWMQNAPAGHHYRQGCLNVDFALDARATAGHFDSSADIDVSAGIADCSGPVTAGCAIVNCPKIASEKAAEQVPDRVVPLLRDQLQGQLAPLFSYFGGPKSPYAGPATGPACNPLSDATCLAQIRWDHLPASLTRMSYGWFANAFASFDSTPAYQYPVVQVEPQCPSGSTFVEHPSGSDICVKCPNSPGPLACEYHAGSGECREVTFGLPCPTQWSLAKGIEFHYATDPDGDGKPSYQDNCPNTSNSSQADQDGDGIGDVCDDCPCTNGPDVDGDEVCATACNGPGDNCPTVANPNQENCNVDAEVARGAELLGDACDPVPCPRFAPVFKPAAIVGEIKSPLYVDVKVKQALDRIDVAPMGSRSKAASTLTEVPVEVTATHYRYCIDNLDVDARCFIDTAIADSWLNKAASAPQEDTTTLWHRVRMQGLGLGVPEGLRTYQTGADFWRAWDYAADFWEWKASSWGAPWVPDLVAAMNKNDPSVFFSFPGRFWVHASTAVGTTDLTNGTGLHALKVNPNQPADSQSNHYRPLTPFTKYAFYQAIGVIDLLFVDRECYWCGSALSVAPVDQCPHCTVEAVSELSSPVSRLVVKNGDGRLGVVSTSGALSPLRTSVGPSLAAKLGSPVLWVDQAEPSAYLGKSLVAPVSVALSTDGALVEQVFSAGGRLIGQGDLVRGPGDGIASLATSAANVQQSPTRSGFIPVYSRSRARVFLVGGSSASGRDVTFRPLEPDGQWQDVPPSELTLGTAVAATFNFTDGQLWVMDEIAGPLGTRVARVLTVDPDSGRSEVLGTFPRLGLFEQHFLRTDHDGAVLLFASSKKHHLNAVVRLDRKNGTLTPAAFRIRPRALALPPVIDAAGYWLVTSKTNGKLDVERLEQLSLVPALGLSQAGQCF